MQIMKILLIGATGNIGQHILQEVLGKGYKVTAVQRNPEDLKVKHPDLTIIKGDLLNEAALPAMLQGQDVIISAISPVGSHTPEQFKKANQHLIAALDWRTDRRVIIVGGAGNTEIAPGVKVMDSAIMDQLPEEWKPAILIHGEVLELYKQSGLSWTYFCPAKDIEPGERTGKYRLGTTNMVIDDNGESKISREDYAVALVEEIENKWFVRQQCSIGY
jgi:putative NADH-flavin reductase